MKELLPLFTQPAHYAGGEDGICRKNPEEVSLRIALAFPDVYEVGMSYLGHKILYSIVNRHTNWFAERVMCPDRETAAILRQHGAPLATLETDYPLNNLDAVGFAITHELCYTDVLHMLDLAQIPLRHKDRSEDFSQCPLIMAGGGALAGGEPLMPFLDLASLGDGEESLPEILSLLEKAKKQGWTRSEFLDKARLIPGVYIPSLFSCDAKGVCTAKYPDYRPARRIAANLDEAPYPVSQVTPVGAVHNRLVLEIARGCTRGCRFCHAGMVYRPVRERSPEKLASILDACLTATGFEEISFLSLSAGDYTALRHLQDRVWERCAQEQITLSLPSLRVGSIDDSVLAKMASLRRTGITIAPEAGSQRLRDIINKGITEEEIIQHIQKLLAHGWRHVKLYFMIGLPQETDDDLKAIADLCRKARDAGGPGSARLQVTASISPFVPKPFTPFQWEEQIDLPEITRRINLVRSLFKGQKSLVLRWHEPKISHLEGILSRAGREMADVLEKAYKKGAMFCSWAEYFDLKPWLEALEECGFSAQEYIRARAVDQPLPWDHLEAGVSKDFLLTERKRAFACKTTPDCRTATCRHCGACDTLSSPSLLARAPADASKYKHKLVFTKRDQPILAPVTPCSAPADLAPRPAPPEVDNKLTTKAAAYRVWHEKTGAAAYLSQLDLQSAISHALRRARLPVAFSSGFHPMPLLSFGKALPVGVESKKEWFSVTFHACLPVEEIKTRLNRVLSPGLQAISIEQIDRKERAMQSIQETFELTFKNACLFKTALEKFSDFFARKELSWKKESKKGDRLIDIRPLLLDWTVSGSPEAEPTINFTADWSSGYLSPLKLILAILQAESRDILADFTLVKTGQIFPDAY